MLNEYQFFLIGQIQTSQTWGQTYSDTSPYNKVSLVRCTPFAKIPNLSLQITRGSKLQNFAALTSGSVIDTNIIIGTELGVWLSNFILKCNLNTKHQMMN